MTMGSHPESQLRAEVIELADASLLGELNPADAERLYHLVCTNERARQFYLEFMADSVHLQLARGRLLRGQPQEDVGSADESRADHIPQPSPQAMLAKLRVPRRRLISYAAAVVVLMATGILFYTLWPKRPAQPVAVKPVVDAAATLISAPDAQWLGSFRPQDNSIAPGQRLVLERGSAEITFSRQARMIIEGPADVVIVDGGACRLASGKLTAHVPTPAKGFQVHTPDGTVTDLGTEFGVYVKTAPEIEEPQGEQEQPTTGGPQQDGTQPPVTEVHVFQGQVELAPKSQIPNPKSQIVSAGQAVTISEKKIQPLAAADPFKFALDKLQGQPRQVLLTDDFEAYDLARQVKSLGPWIVQSGIRKGQGVSVENPIERIAAANAEVDVSVQLPAPPALVGSRVANFGTSAQNSPDTYPVLSREIDGKLLAKNCQVRVEFDFFPRSDEPQLSLALATQLGHTAGIELWRSVNAAKQSVDAAKQSFDAAKQGVDAAKKVDFVAYRWYRIRVLLNVADGVVSEVRVDRSQWRGPEGWVRDLSYRPPTPKLDWSTPPRYAIFGFPVVSPATVGGVFWLDNVRIEVIAEK